MDNCITRQEHEAFNSTVNEKFARLDDENRRQNHRIDSLEDVVNQISTLTVAIERLTVNIQNMNKEMESERRHNLNMDERIKSIEQRDGEMWRTVVKYVLTAVIACIVGFMFAQIGM